MVRGITDNKFDSIPKSGIHKTTNRLSKLGAQFLSRKREQGSERDNGHEIDHKDSGGIHVHCAQNNTRGNEDQQDVDIVARQGLPGEVEEVHRPAHPGAVIFVVGLASVVVGDAVQVAHVAQAARGIGDEGCPLIGAAIARVGPIGLALGGIRVHAVFSCQVAGGAALVDPLAATGARLLAEFAAVVVYGWAGSSVGRVGGSLEV